MFIEITKVISDFFYMILNYFQKVKTSLIHTYTHSHTFLLKEISHLCLYLLHTYHVAWLHIMLC